jgi:hypothetical protein
MQSLDGKPVAVITAEGETISFGKFHLTRHLTREHPDRVELAFETETMACRLRVPPGRIDEIKATWDGAMYRYVLPGGGIWKS